LLLLHHRDDFVQGDWPPALRDRVAEHTRQAGAALEKFAADTFGRAGPDELRRVQFVLANVPVAAVRQHLQRREPPPPIVDELIRATYHAIIGDHHSGRQSLAATKRRRPPRQRSI
jgi:hypothetical protein